MFVPNYRKIYGSQHTILHPEDGDFKRDRRYVYRIELSKYHLNALDQPSDRCANKITDPTTSSCITKFIEAELGCTPRIYGVDHLTPKNHLCNSFHELHDLAKISFLFSEMNANNLYNITGCMASCERDEYERITNLALIEHKNQAPTLSFLRLQLFFADGSYEVKEQYRLYDSNNFFADVGGFLGLLLGCSIFSLYKGLTDLVVRFNSAVCRNGIAKWLSIVKRNPMCDVK